GARVGLHLLPVLALEVGVAGGRRLAPRDRREQLVRARGRESVALRLVEQSAAVVEEGELLPLLELREQHLDVLRLERRVARAVDRELVVQDLRVGRRGGPRDRARLELLRRARLGLDAEAAAVERAH